MASFPKCENLSLAGDLSEADVVVGRSQNFCQDASPRGPHLGLPKMHDDFN